MPGVNLQLSLSVLINFISVQEKFGTLRVFCGLEDARLVEECLVVGGREQVMSAVLIPPRVITE